MIRLTKRHKYKQKERGIWTKERNTQTHTGWAEGETLSVTHIADIDLGLEFPVDTISEGR